jgi:hypothetical protein
MAWSMPRKEVLKAMFHPDLATYLSKSDFDTTEWPFGKVLIRAISMVGLLRGEHLTRRPTNRSDFFEILTWFMSKKAIQILEENFRRFDDLVGMCDSLSDDFISHRSFEQWIFAIANKMILQNSSESTSSSYSKTTQSDTTSASSTTTLSPTSHRQKHFGYDETNDEGGRVQQIRLRGANIKDAWAANSTMSELEEMVGRAAGSSWTPNQAGRFYVYHGTSAHFDAPQWASTWNSPVHTVQASTNESQLGPQGVPLVFTAFSPLRSFLWAVFTSDLLQNIPSTQTLSKLQQKWSVGDAIFEGVALFQFYSTQPAPSGLTSWTGDELRWGSAVLSHRGKGLTTASKFWESGRLTLGGSDVPASWPDVLHSREFGKQKDQLRGFGMNMWRSVWLRGKGVDRLNQDYARTFAITFELVTRATRDKAEPKKSPVKTLAKKISKMFKKNT